MWSAAEKRTPSRLKSSEVDTNIRKLIVQLTQGNVARAAVILDDISAFLDERTMALNQPGAASTERARQTMFAMEEVRVMLTQNNCRGALDAARDAAKEWNALKVVPNGKES